jgi:hypothetical protein
MRATYGIVRKVREYVRSRARDPVTWLAASVIVGLGVSAATGLSPYQVLNLVCFVFAGMEWWALASWRRMNRRNRADVVSLRPALDRWKIALLILIAAVTFVLDLWVVTFVLDLWVGSSAFSLIGLGLSVFGISSIITLGYAWSRPIMIAPSGIHVGIETVSWTDVRQVTWTDAGEARIDFVVPSYFYGSKITVPVSFSDAAAISAMLPESVERRGTPERADPAITT